MQFLMFLGTKFLSTEKSTRLLIFLPQKTPTAPHAPILFDCSLYKRVVEKYKCDACSMINQ